MLYELRLYQCGMGRAQDVSTRLRDLVPAEFKKHGFPVPSAQWFATAGPKLPLYIWMLAWPNSEVRAKAFGALWSDPHWQKLRAETNGEREMVLKYDIYLMHQTEAANVVSQLHGHGTATDPVHELRVHEIWPGKTAYAIDRLCRVDLPALKSVGATTLGVFDIQSGPTIPALAHFLTWPSYEAREKGLASYEAHPEVAALNRSEAEEFKSYAIGRHDTWLLRPADFCPPLLGFAERPWYR
jgi:NIPSNAP